MLGFGLKYPSRFEDTHFEPGASQGRQLRMKLFVAPQRDHKIFTWTGAWILPAMFVIGSYVGH
jgi:hypothetical protein